jgi:hypothetical protein
MYTADNLSAEATKLLFEMPQSKTVVAIKPQLKYALRTVDKSKSGDAALLLSQLIYWSSKPEAQERDGWFYVTREELFTQTGLTIYEQQETREFLKDLKLIEDTRRGTAGKTHYRVNLENVTKLYAEVKGLWPSSVVGHDQQQVVEHGQQRVVGHGQQRAVGHGQQHSKEAKTLPKTHAKTTLISHSSDSEKRTNPVSVSKSRFSLVECEEFAHSLNRTSGYEVREKPIRNPGGFAYKIWTTGSHDAHIDQYNVSKAKEHQDRIARQVDTAVWWLTNGHDGHQVTTWSQLREVLDVELWPLLQEPIKARLSVEHPELLARLDGEYPSGQEAVA